jgi:hypothetical protein
MWSLNKRIKKVGESMKIQSKGYLLVTVLVFGAAFFTIISGFIGYIITQSNLINQKVELQLAGDIAEGGLNYYKWFLAHFPGDTTDGTGLPGPYVHTYYDPEGGAIGEFSLEVAGTTYCGDVASIEVTSTGSIYQNPDINRTISARYARPSVADYSFIINSKVWAGADRIINGPYHSNDGIRMDGTNNSIVTSGQASWDCDGSFGCSPASTTDGVFTSTANSNPALFSFPSAPINFTGLTVDLSVMKDRAQNAGGIFLPASGAYGYQVIFNADGTITVNQVTDTLQYWGYSSETFVWALERHVISDTAFVANYTIPADCPLIFVEDKLWLEGVVDQKVSIAAADVISSAINPSIILANDITYTSATSSGLLAIAEQDVLVGLDTPDDMFLNGIFIAQNGHYGRNHYHVAYLTVSLAPFVIRNSLNMNGSIVSNGRVGTSWGSSGFMNRVNNYDRNLVLDPPPLIPRTSDVSVITDWRDER